MKSKENSKYFKIADDNYIICGNVWEATKSVLRVTYTALTASVKRIGSWGKQGVTANGHGVSFWGDENIQKLILLLVIHFYKYI